MLRVMTVNLLNGAGSPVQLARLLVEHQPDLLAAQELSPNQATVLENHFAHGVCKPRTDNAGTALMSQREMPVSVVPLPYRDALAGAIDVDGEAVEVIAVHLANPIDGPLGRLRERRRQVRAITPRLSRPGNRILIGDLNSTPLWPAYRRLVRHTDDTVSAWAKLHDVPAQRTWGWRPGWPAMLRIDHVLAAGLHATGAVARKVEGSDHRALIVDLERSPEA